MPEEHDSWFKSAFGVDLSESLNRITTAVDQAKKTATEMVESVRANASGADASAGSFPLRASVGRGGKNAPGDVRAVQAALGIVADGQCGPKTVAAIKAFQTYMGARKPDGRVDPGGATERALVAEHGRPAFTPSADKAPKEPPVFDMEGSWNPGDGTGDDEGDLMSDLLDHRAALLKSLENAGSEAEREQISEELEGIESEIDIERSALKAAESAEGGGTSAAPARVEDTEDGSVLDEVLEGDFHEGKSTWTGTILNVGVGVVPIVGQVADVRDTAAAAKDLVTDPSWANAGMLGLAAVGWVPFAGDAIKGVVKVGKKAGKEAGEEVLEEAAGEAVEHGMKDAAQEGEAKAAQELSDEAQSKADDAAFDETFSGGLDEGEFHTSEHLKRGNLGEKLGTEWLAAQGHKILSFKPSILGTNQGGIDMVTLKDGMVHFIDNKALSRAGNVSSVSALTTNLGKNKAAVLAEFRSALAESTLKEQQEVLQAAITAIESGNYKLVVMSANVLKKDGKALSGVTDRLKALDVDFIDVFKLGGKP